MIIFLRAFSYTVLFALIVVSCLNAQELQFHTLTEENVLDKHPVLSIVQDSKGQIWFAGANDIYNYNAAHVTNMKYQDTSWNKVGYITKLAINTKDELFIISSTGLHIYNTNNQIFTDQPYVTTNPQAIPLPKDVHPLDIFDIQSSEDYLFICTKKGLYTIDYKKRSYLITPIFSGKAVFTLTKAKKDTYLFATSNTIEQLRIDNKSHKHTISTFLNIPVVSTSGDLVTSLFYDEQQLWIGTKIHGLYQYRFQNKQLINYHQTNSNLLSNYIRKITKGIDGHIWIGTLKGLSVYTGVQNFRNHKHNSLTSYSLSQNSIYDIFVDRQQITWVGTYFGGMNMIYPHTMAMRIFSTKNSVFYRLSSDIVGSMAESQSGYWVGTEEEGINFLNKKTQHITAFPHYAQSNLIKDLYLRDNKLYVAQFSGGYSVSDLKKNTVTHHLLDKDTLSIYNNVFSIYADPNHNLYLGTNAGLYIIKSTESEPALVNSLPKTTITNISQDINGNIYTQIGNQLYVKRKTGGDFKQVHGTASLSINGFHLDGDHIWLTSGNSVYRLTNQKPLEAIFSWKEKHLGAILKLDNKLWITSPQGLVYYDLNSHYKNILTTDDGLPTNNLGSAKIYADQEKNILIATRDGLVFFPTHNINFNKHLPQLFLTDIKVNDSPLAKERIQYENNGKTVTVHLKHNENFLSIDFSNSNLIKPAKNRYRYLLQDFDNDWKEVSMPNIQYTNLPIGKHILTVYASNNDMIWTQQPFTISLIVHPPFYLTWWAYVFYAMLALTVIHFVIKFIVEREILVNSEKEHEKKIKFFTQVSHEIRTPLTLITTPLDEIISETVHLNTTQQKVIRIKKNANKLLSVINELLDFKKFDDKQQKLRLQKVDLNAYLEDAFYLLSDFAQTKDLNYYIRKVDKVGLFWLDTQQFDKVMFNLLSNAIKYTPAGRTVYLELIKTSLGATIRIVDNGIGVSEANQFKIFEEYYRQESTEDVIGTGIGLALTKTIVEQHQGSISCQTLKEDGIPWTVFQIELTQQANHTTDEKALSTNTGATYLPDESNMSGQSLQAITREERKEILLIVEDNKELLNVIGAIFQESYEVLTARDGQEGLDKAKHYLPDLIISDMMMPKMNGLELCENLKGDTLTSHIPFVLLTAVNDENIHTETLKHGANIYITKPFDKGQLYLSVRNLLAISQKRRKNFQINTKVDNEIDQKFIAALDQLIENHLMDDGFDVNFISRSMGMSAPILYRKLKAITDLSLNNYVKSYRLNKAKELLTSQMNISEVAYAVGFSDRKYFSKEFKKQFGVNPSEYIATRN